jgi:hypothetical protein
MTMLNELIDELFAGQKPASVMGGDGLLSELRKALLNRLTAAELGPVFQRGQELAQRLLTSDGCKHTFWSYGSARTRAPSSGCGPTTNCATAGSAAS